MALGSDGKQYKQLVKGGDDTRQVTDEYLELKKKLIYLLGCCDGTSI